MTAEDQAEAVWLVEPEIADLMGRALMFAAGEEYGGTSMESFEDDERWRMAEAGQEMRARAAAHLLGEPTNDR